MRRMFFVFGEGSPSLCPSTLLSLDVNKYPLPHLPETGTAGEEPEHSERYKKLHS